MSKKRVLVAHPRVTASGGGNAVAAWTLQALGEHCDLSLATLQPLDYAADKIERVLTNAALETELRTGMEARRTLFTAETFCATVREIVEWFE
jgi:hypothetical protein